MKQIYSLLIISLIMVVFSNSNHAYGQTKDYTVIIYMNGSDLESGSDAGTTDLGEMMAASSLDFSNVVVLTGGADKAGWRVPKAWHVEKGKKTELSNFSPHSNAMSDLQNLTKFIDFSIIEYDAQDYILIMWNHGMGIRGYGWDEVSDAQLSVPQVKQAIENTNFIKGGKKFEIIGFDACLMATLEVQSNLTGFADYFIGSEETEPGHGWDYTPILNAIEAGDGNDNSIPGDMLGQVIIDGFKAQSEAEETSNVTLGLIELSKIPDLVTKLEALFNKIKQESKISSLQKARAASEEYSKAIKNPGESEDLVDVGDLMKHLKIEDASLAASADEVLNAVNDAVKYSKHDDTRPKSTGISMFLPHNKFADNDCLQAALDDDYNPIGFSSTIKDFIVDTYIPSVQSDNNPPTGTQVDGFNPGKKVKGKSASSEEISAILVEHAEDLDQVQVVLVEEFEGHENEFILLGSTLPDTGVFVSSEAEIFAYFWNEQWIGINGYPAYISDIHEFAGTDENGNPHNYTRIHIPAVMYNDQYPEPNGRDIILTYLFDEAFNVTLESIEPETYGEQVLVPGKERIKMKPGDRVQLLYEVFNEETDEEYFIVYDDDVIEIENGNTDLHLEHNHLFPGNYHIGYVLMDHAHNDTIIFDSKTFTVLPENLGHSFKENGIQLYPNPSDQQFTIENSLFNGQKYEVRIYDMVGRLQYAASHQSKDAIIDTRQLANGSYAIKIFSTDKIYQSKFIVQH